MRKCQECGGVDGHLPPCSEAMDREQAVAHLRRQLAAANERAGRLEELRKAAREYWNNVATDDEVFTAFNAIFGKDGW